MERDAEVNRRAFLSALLALPLLKLLGNRPRDLPALQDYTATNVPMHVRDCALGTWMANTSQKYFIYDNSQPIYLDFEEVDGAVKVTRHYA